MIVDFVPDDDAPIWTINKKIYLDMSLSTPIPERSLDGVNSSLLVTPQIVLYKYFSSIFEFPTKDI